MNDCNHIRHRIIIIISPHIWTVFYFSKHFHRTSM